MASVHWRRGRRWWRFDTDERRWVESAEVPIRLELRVWKEGLVTFTDQFRYGTTVHWGSVGPISPEEALAAEHEPTRRVVSSRLDETRHTWGRLGAPCLVPPATHRSD